MKRIAALPSVTKTSNVRIVYVNFSFLFFFLFCFQMLHIRKSFLNYNFDELHGRSNILNSEKLATIQTGPVSQCAWRMGVNLANKLSLLAYSFCTSSVIAFTEWGFYSLYYYNYYLVIKKIKVHRPYCGMVMATSSPLSIHPSLMKTQLKDLIHTF